MKTRILKIIFLFLITNYQLSAQTKMEIYTNPNIVWAGIVDIDIIIDKDSLTDWKHYEISGLGGFLKQHSKPLKPNQKALNEIIIEDIYDVSVYQTDSLKYKYDYNMLDIFYEVENPEYYGYEQKKLPAALSDVFRLRSFIYYDKSTLNFKIQPLAVCMMRSEDDTGNAISYTEIGWLSVSEWTEMMNINNENITFAKRFYRDIAFEDVRVFKQEWTIAQTMESMMNEIRQQSETITLFTINPYYDEDTMSNYTIKQLATEEVITFNIDTFDEESQDIPLSSAYFKGLRLNLDWLWNDDNQSLYIHQTGFSPLMEDTDDGKNPPDYNPLFLKKVD